MLEPIFIRAVNIQAASTSETSVHFHQTTRYSSTDDSNLNNRRRHNLDFRIVFHFNGTSPSNGSRLSLPSKLQIPSELLRP